MNYIAFDYYYGSEGTQYSFYRIPKALITESHFSGISTDAKLLYGLMLDRMSLSIKNQWIDPKGRVFIYYTVNEITEHLRLCKEKAVKILAELDGVRGIGLIERIRQGQGKPDRIYVKHFAKPLTMPEGNIVDPRRSEIPTSASMSREPPEVGDTESQRSEIPTSDVRSDRLPEVGITDPQRSEIPTSSVRNNLLPEVGETDPNYNNINYTDKSYTNQSIYQSGSGDDGMDRIDRIRAETRGRIEYDILCSEFKRETVDELAELIVEVLSSSRAEIQISGSTQSAVYVKNRFSRIGRDHIEYILFCMSKNTTKISNIKNYLLTALFNSTFTIEHFYKAEVQHDMNGRND